MSCGVPDWTQALGSFNLGKTIHLNREIAVVKMTNSITMYLKLTRFLHLFCVFE